MKLDKDFSARIYELVDMDWNLLSCDLYDGLREEVRLMMDFPIMSEISDNIEHSMYLKIDRVLNDLK